MGSSNAAERRRGEGAPLRFRRECGSSTTTCSRESGPPQKPRVLLDVSGGGLAHLRHTPSTSGCRPKSLHIRRPVSDRDAIGAGRPRSGGVRHG